MSKPLTPEENKNISPVIAAAYYLHNVSEDGIEYRIALNGEEVIITICPECRREHSIKFNDFCAMMADGDFCPYSTMVFCTECSAKRDAVL